MRSKSPKDIAAGVVTASTSAACVVPPSQKIPEKCKDDPNLVSYLEDKISSGSKGVWSTSAKDIPANPMLKRDKLKLLAEWVAGTK